MRRGAAAFVLLCAFGFILYASREGILTSLGAYLVATDEPRPTEIAVVLGGDGHGNRVLKGCELVRQGLVKKAWVSGPATFYGETEPRLAIAFAIRKGCPAEYFEAIDGNPDSTRDEAHIITQLMKQRGIRELTLVTSNFHTRRAGKIFREVDPGIGVGVIAATDPDFTPSTWWKSRHGRKIFFFEWTKTITERLGL